MKRSSRKDPVVRTWAWLAIVMAIPFGWLYWPSDHEELPDTYQETHLEVGGLH